MAQTSASTSFDLIAPVYDGLAKLVFGGAQERAQGHFLSTIPKGAHVLVVGGGTGWILMELLKVARPGHVVYLEASEKMLEKAKSRFQKMVTPTNSQVTFRLGTEQELPPQEKFHVVITPFVLDLFPMPEARQMMRTLDAYLHSDGVWLHTDFRESVYLSKRLWQRPFLWCMYRFFGWVSHISAKKLPAFDQLFKELGLCLEEEALFYGDFICAQKYRKPSA